MRYIFWILIIFNIGAFVYFGLNDTGNDSLYAGKKVTGRPLVLLQEEEPPPVPAPEDLPEIEQADVASSEGTEQILEQPEAAEPREAICYSISPFETEKDTLPVRKVLKEHNLVGVSDEVSLRIPTGGYWVFLSPYDSRETAKGVANELAAKGVADYYILTGGEYKNAISLGLYSGKNFAEKRARIIRGFGYDPVVSPRYRVERHLSVKYRIPGDYQINDSFIDLLDNASQGARQEIIDCVFFEDLIE